MAADVGSLVQLLSRYRDDRTAAKDSVGPTSTVSLTTRDLLGTSSCHVSADQSLDLDLDLQAPNGWEKRLDLKSGKVYMQKCHSTNSSNQTVPRLQDLNFPPNSVKSPAKPLLSLFDDTSLELKLVSRPPHSDLSSSVCTLDKVKSALARAEKDSSAGIKKRRLQEEVFLERTASAPVVVGCQECLSYVLVMKNNPKCPRCHSFVSLPSVKRPRIDLNISI